MRPQDRSDAGAEGAVAVLGGAAGASAGFCSKIVLERAGGQGMRAPCCARAMSSGGFVASGRWQTDEPGRWVGTPRWLWGSSGTRGAGWPGTVLGQIGSPWPPTAPLLGFPPCHRGWGRVTVLGAWGQPDGGPGPHGEAEPGCWVLGAGCSTRLEEVAGEMWLSSGTERGTGAPSPAGEGLSSSFLVFPTRNPS